MPRATNHLRLLIGSILVATILGTPPVLVALGSNTETTPSLPINHDFSPVSGDDEESWIDDMILLMEWLCALTNCTEAQVSAAELTAMVDNFVTSYDAHGLQPNLTEQERREGLALVEWGLLRLGQDPGVLPSTTRENFDQALISMKADLSLN